MERLFVDTSAWFAFANRKDPDHARVSMALNGFQGRLATSNFVFDETVSLCRYRLGFQAAEQVGGVLLDPSSIDLICVLPEDERAAWAMFRARPDQRYSFTDCTSFIVMRRLGILSALALDEDFRAEGFEVAP